MMRQGMLVRRLSAVEGLGATTVICADKTGTLTENRMTVECWYLGGREFTNGAVAARAESDALLARALAIGVLCNEAELENGGAEIRGSSTEGALLTAAMDVGVDYRHARDRHPLVSIRRRADGDNWMASVHADGAAGRLVAVKGAPEQVVRLTNRWLDGTTVRPMTVDSTRDVLVANARMAARGLRVLGLAFREDHTASELSYDGLVWVGLVGLTDPVRPGVREAIAACRRAGIRTVILTGDQAATAAAISRELELSANGHPRTLDAAQLADADGAELRRRAREVDVFSRVSPADKHQIVRAFQANGEIVAMTGDGINDAAALRTADVGVAMGTGGTDMAREVADVVLIENDLGAMVKAVEQGRSIRTQYRPRARVPALDESQRDSRDARRARDRRRAADVRDAVPLDQPPVRRGAGAGPRRGARGSRDHGAAPRRSRGVALVPTPSSRVSGRTRACSRRRPLWPTASRSRATGPGPRAEYRRVLGLDERSARARVAIPRARRTRDRPSRQSVAARGRGRKPGAAGGHADAAAVAPSAWPGASVAGGLGTHRHKRDRTTAHQRDPAGAHRARTEANLTSVEEVIMAAKKSAAKVDVAHATDQRRQTRSGLRGRCRTPSASERSCRWAS